MKAYRVTHKPSGDRYFLLADSADHAVEVVGLRINDPEGVDAWVAAAEEPDFTLKKGVVYDRSGKTMAPLE